MDNLILGFIIGLFASANVCYLIDWWIKGERP